MTPIMRVTLKVSSQNAQQHVGRDSAHDKAPPKEVRMGWNIWNQSTVFAFALIAAASATSAGFATQGSEAIRDWAVDTVNLNIYHAMDSRLPDGMRAKGLKNLESACVKFFLPMSEYCADEIHEAALYLQNKNEPALVRSSAKALSQSLNKLFPKGLRLGVAIVVRN